MSEVDYADSNTFIAPLLSEDSRTAVSSRRVLASIEGATVAYTSMLARDEVVWGVSKVLGKADAQHAGDKLLGSSNLRFIAASEENPRLAQRPLSEHDVAPRSAIRIASAIARSV